MAKKVRLELDFTLESPYWNNQQLPASQVAATLNCVIEKYPNEDGSVRTMVRKRPGLSLQHGAIAGAFLVAGMYYTPAGGLWRAVDSKLYYNDTLIVNPLRGASAGFVELPESAGVGRTFFCDGTDAYILTPGVATLITDVDFPRPHIPMPVFMDGYVFLQEESTGKIKNSALNDATSWDPLNFIEAAAFPDKPAALVRVKNSIVALGRESIEFFYNAGNAKGSPLSPMQAQQISMGCVDYRTVQLINDKVYFMARNSLGGAVIMELDGLNLRTVSTPGVNNFLNSQPGTLSVDSTAFNISGHPLYIINAIYASLSMVYDASNGSWTVWTDAAGSGLFRGKYASSFTASQHKVYVCDRFDARVWLLNIDAYSDNITTPIYSSISTLRFDGGTMNRKFQRGIEVLYSKVPASLAPSGSNLTMYTTDDDESFQQKAVFSLSGGYRAYIKSVGSFRRRRFSMVHNSIAPFLLEGIELEYDEGTN